MIFAFYISEIDHCDENPCENDGICESGVDGFTCSCKVPFHGQSCERSLLRGPDQSQNKFFSNQKFNNFDFLVQKGFLF